MAWQQPKTDWSVQYDENGKYIGDYFGANDYMRIRGNLLEIAKEADEVYLNISSPDIPSVTDISFYTEKEINALERCIDELKTSTFDPGLPSTKTWVGNEAAPLAEDYNRIERSCFTLYRVIQNQKAARKRLAFTLGGVQF